MPRCSRVSAHCTVVLQHKTYPCVLGACSFYRLQTEAPHLMFLFVDNETMYHPVPTLLKQRQGLLFLSYYKREAEENGHMLLIIHKRSILSPRVDGGQESYFAGFVYLPCHASTRAGLEWSTLANYHLLVSPSVLISKPSYRSSGTSS